MLLDFNSDIAALRMKEMILFQKKLELVGIQCERKNIEIYDHGLGASYSHTMVFYIANLRIFVQGGRSISCTFKIIASDHSRQEQYTSEKEKSNFKAKNWVNTVFEYIVQHICDMRRRGTLDETIMLTQFDKNVRKQIAAGVLKIGMAKSE